MGSAANSYQRHSEMPGFKDNEAELYVARCRIGRCVIVDLIDGTDGR